VASIQVLAPEVADAIAAGEVVERPASVVKELVENALDAGAHRISVEVRGAGRTLVRVVDDGAGIAPEEQARAFLRHATSKVASLSDLDAIASLGFRGEALASIAAVAEVECRSQGAIVRLRAGEVLEHGAAGPAPGTVMEVRDLFANTPARLRFLKTDATETAATVQVVRTYALLHPDVRFELVVDGRRALATPGDGDWRRAATAVHGEEVSRGLLEVAQETVTGLVSEARISRGTRDGIVLAVNGRPIASRSLQYALEEAYLGALEKGRYPVAVLDLALDPSEVDVNVHPAKREVRFHDERAAFSAVQRAVREALGGSRVFSLPLAAAAPAAGERASFLDPVVHDAPAQLVPHDLASRPAPGAPLRPLGQVLDGYLVAESADGLVLVDQHAAHERLLYNRLLGRLRGGPGATQPLLLAQVVELEPSLAAAANDAAPTLAGLGFEIEPFGPGALRVLATPVETPPGRVEEVVLDLLATLAGSRADDRLQEAAASVACHSAVRFGDQLDLAEQRRLLEDLEHAGSEALTCPHGRPTRLLISNVDLRRHFRRNY
jgi:DNA mismatch repair protein MutL